MYTIEVNSMTLGVLRSALDAYEREIRDTKPGVAGYSMAEIAAALVEVDIARHALNQPKLVGDK